jgi:uncharacterized protein YecT (DUF1311 family)
MFHYRCAVVSACLLSLTGAHAGQYCGDLKRDSAAYFACEALNKQEIIEQNRQREQENSDLKARIERQTRDAEERSRREQERTTRERERITREQNQEKQQHTTELMPIALGLNEVNKALAESGGCDRAQKSADETRVLIKSSRPVYLTNGNVTTREQLRDALIALQSTVYLKCLNDPQRTRTLMTYLDKEAKNGSHIARELFDDLKKSEVNYKPAVEGAGKSKPGQPSFNCKYAKSAAEKLICNDEDLSRLDVELNLIYRKAIANSKDKPYLKANSEAAWAWREKNCNDRSCILKWYSDRKATLLADFD